MQCIEDEAEFKIGEQLGKEAEQRSKQKAKVLHLIIKEDIYESDFGEPNVTSTSELGTSIIEIETICNENENKGRYKGLKRSFVELHVQVALPSLYKDEVIYDFDEIRVKSTIHNWHEKVDDYEATASGTQKQANDITYKPKVKVEKIQ